MNIELYTPTTGTVVATVTGELDADNCNRLGAAILEGRGDAPSVMVDLGAVTFLDSSAVSELLRIRTELAADDIAMSIGEVSDQVRRVLEITGLLGTFGLD